MRTRTKIVALAGVLLMGAVLLLWPRYERGGASVATETAIKAVPVGSGSQRAASSKSARAAAVPAGDAADMSGQTVLERYKAWSQYPPNSRPLKEGQVDITEPFIVATAPQQLTYANGVGERMATQFYCVLQPLRHTILEGEQLTVTLACTKGGPGVMEGGHAVSAEVTDVRLRGHNPQGEWEAPVTGVFNDKGLDGDVTAGDLEYAIRLAPRKGDWGDMVFEVELVIPEDERGDKHTLRGSFTAGGSPPARFTGHFDDELADGSLIVNVEVEVEKAGSYRIMGNLFKAEEPLAHARKDLQLQAGVQRVPLLFFGKVLRDSGAVGPYRLVDVRGYRLNTGIDPQDLLQPADVVEGRLARIGEQQSPDREVIAPWTGEYQTHTYGLSSFSAAEWQSPIKARRIADLGRLAHRP